MKKSDKKIENRLRSALTEACETVKSEVNGFKWLTHFVNYNKFPESLSIVCVFNSNAERSEAIEAKRDDYICQIIKRELEKVNIKVCRTKGFVLFDTEEDCNIENDGKWDDRFKK